MGQTSVISGNNSKTFSLSTKLAFVLHGLSKKKIKFKRRFFPPK